MAQHKLTFNTMCCALHVVYTQYSKFCNAHLKLWIFCTTHLVQIDVQQQNCCLNVRYTIWLVAQKHNRRDWSLWKPQIAGNMKIKGDLVVLKWTNPTSNNFYQRCSRGCATSIFVIYSLCQSVSRWPFVKISSNHIHSKTVRARKLKFWEKVHLPPPVICHVSHVMCHIVFLVYI